MARKDNVGAVRVEGGGRGGGGLPRWLLPLLALLALLVLLVLLLRGCGDDEETTSSTTPPAATQPAGGPGGGAGDLTAEGSSLLGQDDLSGRVGQTATGTGVKVVKVVGQQGFWVGRSETDRVYVEYGAKAGTAEAGAEFKPKVGDTVDLTGEVRPAPEQPGRTLKVEADDEALITQQGAFLNADTVTATS